MPQAPEVLEKITASLKQRGTATVADAVVLFKEKGIEVDQRARAIRRASESLLVLCLHVVNWLRVCLKRPKF